MPRGAKKDVSVTTRLYNNGFFHHPKSFVSLDGHLYLVGMDKSSQWALVWKKHHGKCSVCGRIGNMNDPDGWRHEWHHVARCDCAECSELRCGQLARDCHKHRTAGFHRKAGDYESN